MTGIINAYSLNPGGAISAWNPADVASIGNPPFPGTFSNGNRTLTRNTLGPSNYDPACRGTQSRGAPGQTWYFEINVAAMGTNGAGDPYMSFGLLDGTALTGADMSGAASYLLVYGNGSIYRTGFTSSGTLGVGLVANDVVGFVWVYQTEVRVYLNNVLTVTVPFVDGNPMKPFFGCGSTLVGGADSVGTGESLTLQTNVSNQTYSVPAGAVAWG